MGPFNPVPRRFSARILTSMNNETDSTPRPGTRVSYEDMANPLRSGVVSECFRSQWGIDYIIKWDDGTESASDLCQSGWKVG